VHQLIKKNFDNIKMHGVYVGVGTYVCVSVQCVLLFLFKKLPGKRFGIV